MLPVEVSAYEIRKKNVFILILIFKDSQSGNYPRDRSFGSSGPGKRQKPGHSSFILAERV